MHRKKDRKKGIYYAKILFAISFALLGYGFYLDFISDNKLIDPIKGVEKTKEDSNSIHIDTSDKNAISEDNSNATGNTTNYKEKSIEEVNNALRKSIQNTYSIEVKYGAETNGYFVSGIATVPLTDQTLINNQLVKLQNTLKRYPDGLFREIKNGGIPLTIILINNYSDKTVTGITDSSYSYATISISAIHPFEESFYHESYHYIERYLFKKGVNFNSWDSLNPQEFGGWGTINGNLSYSNTFLDTAPFVNNYAQTNAAEDRASTFEYMMASSKASCLNKGSIVWQKAKLLADTMDLVLYTVTPDVTEYWERYL